MATFPLRIAIQNLQTIFILEFVQYRFVSSINKKFPKEEILSIAGIESCKRYAFIIDCNCQSKIFQGLQKEFEAGQKNWISSHPLLSYGYPHHLYYRAPRSLASLTSNIRPPNSVPLKPEL
jgi:hypothetical protein